MKKNIITIFLVAISSIVQAQDMKGMDMNKKTTPATSNKVEKNIPKNIGTKYENNRPSKMVRYDLYVNDTTVNFTGKNAHAMAINGQIPSPVLEFTEGDTAEIYVHNLLSSSIYQATKIFLATIIKMHSDKPVIETIVKQA